MGWKRRDWLFGLPQHYLSGNRGNIGPTFRNQVVRIFISP
jgi:hypothetical protein